jgi:hypothetical protein
MPITMRILQQFDVRKEKEFLELERRFAALERSRPDLPQGRRMKPISGSEPCNTLVWQGEFASLDEARKALDSFAADETHEELFAEQSQFFKSVRIEFYENLEY